MNEPPLLPRYGLILPVLSPLTRVILREMLALAASVTWSAPLMIHGCLAFLGVLFFHDAPSNGLTDLLATIKSHPTGAMFLDWLIPGGFKNPAAVPAQIFSVVGVAISLCIRLSFWIYVLSLPLRLFVPDRFHAGLWFKFACLNLLCLAETAYFLYILRFMVRGPGASYWDVAGTFVGICGFAWLATMSAFVVGDVVLGWCIRRLNREPAKAPVVPATAVFTAAP